MSVNYGILQIGELANKDVIQPRRLEHPCTGNESHVSLQPWKCREKMGPCLPSGDAQVGSRWDSFVVAWA